MEMRQLSSEKTRKFMNRMMAYRKGIFITSMMKVLWEL